MRRFVLLGLLVNFYWANAQGKLFIIGGGKRPPEMVQRMILESGVDKNGYVMILPFASEEQDSSIFYAKRQFANAGISNLAGLICKKGEILSKEKIDSIANAAFIYIPGGDQVKFMEIVAGNEIEKAIHLCYKNGGTVGGTSAGAAVMSKKMITGVELKYKETTEDTEKSGFQSIEKDNIEIAVGLGFLNNAIIDQHFIKRKRQNRLISVAIENPNVLCVGVDEATAILVKNGVAEVVGDSQVLTIISYAKNMKNTNGKLSTKDMKLSLHVPGNKFKIGK